MIIERQLIYKLLDDKLIFFFWSEFLHLLLEITIYDNILSKTRGKCNLPSKL